MEKLNVTFDLSVHAISRTNGFGERACKVDVVPKRANKNILRSKYFLTNQLFGLYNSVLQALTKKTKVSN